MEITEADINQPLANLVGSSKAKVVIDDISDYFEIFHSIESVVLFAWQKNPALNDKKVLSAYNKLKKSFDGQKKGSLADDISKSVKGQLVLGRMDGYSMYTHGEILSCIKTLIKIAKNHRSPNGTGYLHWIKTFFEGNMPETPEDIFDYIEKYES